MTKTPAQLDREIEDRDLAEFVRGAKKYSPLERARLASMAEAILRDRGVATFRANDDELVALARAELDRGTSTAPPKKPALGRINEDQARTMSRFEFIAHWLETVTKKKENRGRLGLYVKRSGKRWQILSPVGGGTVTYETADPSLLFDYARRTQLGPEIRNAEEFRALAFERRS